jgi:molybdopterin converting factor small subunit
LEKTKTNLVTLYNGIQSKSSEMSQMKICSERILLESNKLKKDLEISKKNIESLDAFKSHFLSVRSSLENTFRTDDESNKIRTNFESLSDAQVSEIVSELLADYVELKNQFSIEVKNNIEKMEAKNEEFKNAKNQTLKEEVKLFEKTLK